MPSDNRLQVLIDHGVAQNPGDFSPEAKKIIAEISEVEFNAILTVRARIESELGAEALQQYDHFVTFCF